MNEDASAGIFAALDTDGNDYVSQNELIDIALKYDKERAPVQTIKKSFSRHSSASKCVKGLSYDQFYTYFCTRVTRVKEIKALKQTRTGRSFMATVALKPRSGPTSTMKAWLNKMWHAVVRIVHGWR